jgi:hypothetical protein
VLPQSNFLNNENKNYHIVSSQFDEINQRENRRRLMSKELWGYFSLKLGHNLTVSIGQARFS